MSRSTRPDRAGLLVLSMLLALLAVACASDDPDVAGEDVDLTGGTWELVDGSTPQGPLAAPAGARITLLVQPDGTFGGTAACNSYGGMLTVDGTGIDLGDGISMTEMGCEEPRMTAERRYADALATVDTAERTGDSLVLTGPEVALTFALQPPVEDEALVGTVWQLDTLVEGDAASSVTGDPATLELREDGTFSGGTGCRGFDGEFRVTGDTLTFTSFGMDTIACDDQQARQDDHVVSVLESGVRVEVDGPRLTLLADDGSGLGYRAP